MRMDPLPSDAGLPEVVRAINQLHECQHETQTKVDLVATSLTAISQRLGVREQAPQQKPIKEAPNLFRVYMMAGGFVVMSAGLLRIVEHLVPGVPTAAGVALMFVSRLFGQK